MEKTKHLSKCSECEHFGDGRFPVVNYYVNGELKAEFVGFSDRPNGKAVEHFAHKCEVNTHTLVYDDSCICKDFMSKTWVRPSTCRECICYKHYYDNQKFTCASYPFYEYHCGNDKACPNGKSKSGKQITIFDLIY